MSKEQTFSQDNIYFSVIDGTFRVQVSPDHPEAVAREWETNDGKKGVKYERIVHALFGVIEVIEFHEGDYGTNLNIVLDTNEDGKHPVMSLSISTPYGENALKLLPNLVKDTEYRFRPYSFKDKDSDKDIRGLEITTKDNEGKFTVKVPNFFYDSVKKEALNGYPTPTGDTSTYNSDKWKAFYLNARIFMVDYVTEHVLPKFVSHAKAETPEAIEYPEGLDPSTVPF